MKPAARGGAYGTATANDPPSDFPEGRASGNDGVRLRATRGDVGAGALLSAISSPSEGREPRNPCRRRAVFGRERANWNRTRAPRTPDKAPLKNLIRHFLPSNDLPLPGRAEGTSSGNATNTLIRKYRRTTSGPHRGRKVLLQKPAPSWHLMAQDAGTPKRGEGHLLNFPDLRGTGGAWLISRGPGRGERGGGGRDHPQPTGGPFTAGSMIPPSHGRHRGG